MIDLAIPPRSPLRLLQAGRGANTTISVSPRSPLLFKRLPDLSLSPSSTGSLSSPDPLSPQAYSPLSMLFEGIIADSASAHTIQCQEGSVFPYNSLPSPGSYTCLQSSSDESFASSEASTIVPGPQNVSVELRDGCGRVGEHLDQALEELILQNGGSRPSSRLPLLGENGAEMQLRSGRGEGWGTTDNDTSSILTMPGGGPLLEPLNTDCLSPFWNSPLLQPSALGLFHPSSPAMKLQLPQRGRVPKRPPRPAHCSKTLEDLGLHSFSSIFTPFNNAAPASPSLRSIRKAPAEYLKVHRRTSSIRTPDTFRVPGGGEVFKLDPAPATLRATTKEADCASIISVATFVSARSSTSTSSQHKRQEDRDNLPRYPTTPVIKLAAPPLRQPTQVEESELKDQQRRKREDEARRHPPSASRSPAPAPKHLDLPLRHCDEKSPVIQRKPSLLRKLSLTVLSKKPPKQDPTPTGPTDYSKSPRFSSTLPGINTTVTPFPITIVSSPADTAQQLGRKRSFSRSSPACPPPPSIGLVRGRSTSFTRAIPATPLATPLLRNRSASDLHTHFTRPTRSTSFSSSYPPPSASSFSSHSPLPRKSSLKRTPSRSSSTGSTTPDTPQRRSNRAKIVGSATACISARKVTFGEVTTSRISRTSQMGEESVEVLVDNDTASRGKENKEEEKEDETKIGEECKDSYMSSTLRGFGLQLPQLSLPWGRRS